MRRQASNARRAGQGGGKKTGIGGILGGVVGRVTQSLRGLVQGRTTESLASMSYDDVMGLDERSLRAVVGRIADAANKRLKRFFQAGEGSPAYNKAMETGGKFSTKDKNLNQLRAEYKRAQAFLNSPTGSLAQWRKVKAATMQTLEEQHGIKVDPQLFDIFWQTYERLSEIDPGIRSKDKKYKVLGAISTELLTGADPGQVVVDLAKRLDDITGNNVSDWFDWDEFFGD